MKPTPTTPDIFTDAEVCAGNDIVISTNAVADSYTWTLPDGSIRNTTANTLTISPATTLYAGYYSVMTEISGCNSVQSPMTEVRVNTMNVQAAYAGSDFVVCDPTGEIRLNAQEAAEGFWATASTATILETLNPNTIIGNLTTGVASEFVWTIPANVCHAALQDAVTVITYTKPVATPDSIFVGLNGVSESVDLIVNDNVWDLPYTISIVEMPVFGEVYAYTNGEATYTAAKPMNGTDAFVYEICNLSCPELCDTAMVYVELNGEIFIPDIITANGDGVNDNFMVKGIEFYPNNEVYIYNRWGAEVFHTTDYQNDWKGTYKGDELPTGTYFYLFIDLSTGKVVQKGDFTLHR